MTTGETSVPASRDGAETADSSQPAMRELATVLREALVPALGEEEVDVLPGERPGELDLMTDEWTLHVEGWPDGIAWLALDTEPEDAETARTARRAVMPEHVVGALVTADERLAGALSSSLTGTDDLLSRDLAVAMAHHRTRAGR